MPSNPGISPDLQGAIDSLLGQLNGPVSPQAASPAASQDQPTLADILYQTALQMGGQYAYTKYLPPGLFRQTVAANRAGATSDGFVYFGSGKNTKTTLPASPSARHMGGDPGVGGTYAYSSNAGDKVTSIEQAKNMPYLWDDSEVTEAMDKMQKAGFDVSSFDQMLSVWGGLVDRASKTYTLSGGAMKVSPWDVLDRYKSESPAAFTGSKSTTSRSVNELTEGQSWSVLRTTMQQLLGHDPSDEEIRRFTYKMSGLASKNPSITKTITSYKNGEATGSSSHTSGGFTMDDAAQAAYEQAQNDPDYAEYQAASTYFNAVLSALGPIGG